MRNDILEAYNKGLKIRKKDWKTSWVKKINETSSIDESGIIYTNKKAVEWSFYHKPENWEILPDAFEPEEPQTDAIEHEEPQTDAIQQAIDLLKANGYEIYQITKTKL